MKEKQLNLYGDDMEKFKAVGGTPEELEKETKEDILENKIIEFIAGKEEKKIIKKENELGINQIIELVKEFIGDSKEEDFFSVKKILVKTLLDKGYELSLAVMRAEVEEKNGTLLKPKTETEPELDKRALREKRAKLPYSHRSIPDKDLE